MGGTWIWQTINGGFNVVYGQTYPDFENTIVIDMPDSFEPLCALVDDKSPCLAWQLNDDCWFVDIKTAQSWNAFEVCDNTCSIIFILGISRILNIYEVNPKYVRK